MEKLIDKTVKGTLVGVNENAFAIIAHFCRLAEIQGWEKLEVAIVVDNAISKDYNHLLSTFLNHMEEE